MPPVEGEDFTINITVTTDLPFKEHGCPRWKHQSRRWRQNYINCSQQEKGTAFLGLHIQSFSYTNDAGNRTVTAGNACGFSSKSVLLGGNGMCICSYFLF